MSVYNIVGEDAKGSQKALFLISINHTVLKTTHVIIII